MIIVLELRKFKEKFQFCSKLIENFFDLNFLMENKIDSHQNLERSPHAMLADKIEE